MTYLQLKDLPMPDLLSRIESTACYCRDQMLLNDPNCHTLAADTQVLCHIGDFEVRARFPEPRREELEKKP